jgi:hypothetical protein
LRSDYNSNFPFPANLRLPDWDKEEAKANRAAYPVDTVKQIMEHPRVLQLVQTYSHGTAVTDNFDARGEFYIRKIAGHAGAYAILLRFPWRCLRLPGAH